MCCALGEAAGPSSIGALPCQLLLLRSAAFEKAYALKSGNLCFRSRRARPCCDRRRCRYRCQALRKVELGILSAFCQLFIFRTAASDTTYTVEPGDLSTHSILCSRHGLDRAYRTHDLGDEVLLLEARKLQVRPRLR